MDFQINQGYLVKSCSSYQPHTFRLQNCMTKSMLSLGMVTRLSSYKPNVQAENGKPSNLPLCFPQGNIYSALFQRNIICFICNLTHGKKYIYCTKQSCILPIFQGFNWNLQETSSFEWKMHSIPIILKHPFSFLQSTNMKRLLSPEYPQEGLLLRVP